MAVARRAVRARRGLDAAAGEFVATDVSVVTAGLLSIGLGIGRWYRSSGRLRPAQIARQYTRLILDGLRPRRRRPN